MFTITRQDYLFKKNIHFTNNFVESQDFHGCNLEHKILSRDLTKFKNNNVDTCKPAMFDVVSSSYSRSKILYSKQ